MATSVREAGAEAAGPRRLAWPLFLALSSFYFLGTGGTIDTPDGIVMFKVTESLADRGTSAISPLANASEWGGKSVFDPATGQERFYAKYGLGLSLAAIPTYLAGKALAPFAREPEKDLLQHPAGREYVWYDSSRANFPEAFEAFAASWTNCLVVALAVTGVFLILLELGFATRVSLASALLAGVATPLWPYSKTFFSEPLGAAGLVFFLYFALRGSAAAARGRWLWFLSGASLGVAVLAKPAHLVLSVPAFGLLLSYAMRPSRPEALRRLGAFLAGTMLLFGLIAWYNLIRFGVWWEAGYGDEVRLWTTPWKEGIAGLLISPGRGLFLYCPLWLLAAAGIRRFARRFLREAIFIGACLAVLVGLYAHWYKWEGGWCWGPRYLVPVIPLLALPVASWLGDPPRRRGARVLTLGVVVVAVLVSLSGAGINFADYHDWLHQTFVAQEAAFRQQGFETSTDLYRWSWSYSPLVRYWTFPVRDYFLLFRALCTPGLVLLLYSLAAALLALSFIRLIRNRATSQRPSMVSDDEADKNRPQL